MHYAFMIISYPYYMIISYLTRNVLNNMMPRKSVWLLCYTAWTFFTFDFDIISVKKFSRLLILLCIVLFKN